MKVGRQADGVLAEVNWPLGLSEQAGTGSGARCTRCRGAGEQPGGSRLAPSGTQYRGSPTLRSNPSVNVFEVILFAFNDNNYLLEEEL